MGQAAQHVAQVGVSFHPPSSAAFDEGVKARAALASLAIPEKQPIFLPIAVGRIAFSTRLSSISMAPACRYTAKDGGPALRAGRARKVAHFPANRCHTVFVLNDLIATDGAFDHPADGGPQQVGRKGLWQQAAARVQRSRQLIAAHQEHRRVRGGLSHPAGQLQAVCALCPFWNC